MMTPGMTLGPRLAAIAELVLAGQPLADIGTDHGRLPTALVLAGRVPWAVACDRSLAPLARARVTVERAGAADRVQLRLGEGLAPLAAGEVATVVIAGMGAPTMLAILAADHERTRSLTRLILQPNFGHEQLRRGLSDVGLALVEERLVVERGRFHGILVAETGAAGVQLDELQCLVGPHLLRRGGALLQQQLEQELRRCEREAAGLARAIGAVDPRLRAGQERRRGLLLQALENLRRHGHPGPT